MVDVSIVVPVYNAEKYLDRSVNSLINQTEKNIEIILINDGSKDKSYEKMQEFAKKDNRIRIYTQENKGVAYTRNRGISLASGEYIYFADSDDFVYKEAVSTLLGYAKKFNTNYVRMACIRDISNSKGKIVSDVIYKEPTFVERENFKEKVFDTFLYKHDLNRMGVFLISKKFLVDNNICFDENSFYAEDYVFCLKVFMKLENAVFIPDTYYYYINNAGSITTKITYESVQAKIKEAVKNYSYLFDFFDEFHVKKYNKQIHKRVYTEAMVPIKSIYYGKNDFSKEERIKMIDYAKKTLKENHIKFNMLNSKFIDKIYFVKYRFLGVLKAIAKKILFR